MLYIRKLVSLLLDELYRRINKSLINKKIIVKEKEHMFTICIKDIKNVEKDIITLIIDFLKHIRYRTSQIIHIQDEEIKFQKEILYECLDTRIECEEEWMPLKEVSSLIFENVEKKNKKMNTERKEVFKKIEKVIKEEIKQIKEEENKNSEEEDDEVSSEDEEERIRKIIQGDENAVKMNLIFQFNRLLKKIKINQVELGKKYEEMKNIDGNFLYDSWLKSFKEEDFKKDSLFLKYIKVSKITSLANMGFYLNEILNGFRIYFNVEEPNKFENKIGKKKLKKNVKFSSK